jgi:hypothetical protein
MDEDLKELSGEIVLKLRNLSHDLSNAIENVMQASYLLAQSPLDEQSKKWLKLIDEAANEAAHVNREVREILRSHS